jgi:ParB family chromosome partitioning protein
MPKKHDNNSPKKDVAAELPVIPEPEFKIISLDLIDDPERPMRTEMTPLSVEDLVMSIKQVGLIEPIVVKPKNGRYEVIAGHRRKFAHEIAKIAEIACYVMAVNNEETEMLKIHENLYRAEVKPSDEAEHYKYLIDKHKFTPIKIAQLVGKSQSYVGDRLAIFNYPPFLREAMDKKQITFSVARELARVDDIKTMNQYVFYAIRNGLTSDGATKWVQDYFRAKNQPTVEQQVVENEFGDPPVVESIGHCIYCQEAIKLMEADVVYIHPFCRQEATKPQPQQ